MRFAILIALALGVFAVPVSAAEKSELVIVVMDPLSAPLSCPCVAGYAQRDYEKLAKYLEKVLDRTVKVYFSESLTNALKKKTEGRADLIIGKESVVRHEAKENKLSASPLASLTGKDGKTTMTGLFVVAGKDPALTIADIKGHRIYFGNPECDEKYGAAFQLMKDLGVKYEGKIETCNSCSDGATKVVDGAKGGEKIATVVSSYAGPLLEGCGTIKKGDVKVIGETDPVPFIVAFINEQVPSPDREAIQKALFAVAKDAELCKVLETKLGFVKFESGKKK